METKTYITVYAESTPNPNSMKFVANKMLVDGGKIIEFTSPEETKHAPLAARIFNFPFVTGVFITSNFITVNKNDLVDWNDVVYELREFIKEYLNSGKPLFTEEFIQPNKIKSTNSESEIKKDSTASFHAEPKNDIEMKIVETLEEYVRPAVESDGGAIHFKSFENGIVTVVLRGSCSGCPSSTMTLKAGIEGLLKRMVPGVEEVVAEAM